MQTKRWVVAGAVLAMVTTLAACGSSSGRTLSSGNGAGSVDVTMADYAFSVSGKLTEGEQIHVKNTGSELHMMGLAKMKPGATIDQIKAALAKADPNSQDDPTKEYIAEDVNWPGGMVGPGNEATVSATDLSPGSYALVCFIGQEGTGKPHFSLGMVNQLDVVAGSAKKAKKPDASYTATEGSPITGPATLKAGVRTIEVTGTGDPSKLQPQLVRADSAAQTPDQINDVFKKELGGFGGPSGPTKGSGKRLAPYLEFFGFDLGKSKTVTITFDFKPGTYYLVAPPDTGDNNDITVPKELIKISVT
jgi:hypothetical protein